MARRLRTVALGTLAALLAAAAFTGGGILIGWTWADARASQESAGMDPLVIQVGGHDDNDYGDAVLMPDVRGLDRQTALTVLADAGVATSAITVETRPAAGESGLVIEQSPAFSTPSPGDVTLVVSSPAVVPDFEGVDADALFDDLAELGADVVITRSYVAGVAADTVLGITPEPGETIPAQVTVELAEAASSVFLANVDEVAGGCSSGTVALNAVDYDTSIQCRADTGGREVAWLADRAADTFQATVGIPDDDEPGPVVQVQIVADGVVVGTATASYGAPAELTAPITGALRITMIATVVGGDDRSADVALGNARFIGGYAAISGLGS